jgi:teichuronic acid biosynthesis glycosyltransferase TuaG
MNPTVTVIIYYKEDRGWLNEAIQSVMNQRYNGKIQLLTSDLIEGHENMNASENLNSLIKLANGEYIRYLSEDDLLPQYSIHQSIETLLESGADFIHGKAVNFFGYPVIYPEGHISFSGRTEKQEPKLHYPTLTDLLTSNVIHGGTVVYKSKILKEFLFDEGLTCAEEYDLNMKLLKNGFKLDYSNAFLYFYRRHAKQKSLGLGIDQVERAKKINEIKDRYR